MIDLDGEEPTRIMEADELRELLEEARRAAEQDKWPALLRRKSSTKLQAVKP